MAPSIPQVHGTEDVSTSSLFSYGMELADVGVIIQALLFGFCLATTGLCLYYTFRRWNKTRSQYIITSFMLLLLAYNIVVFGLNITSVIQKFHMILGFFQTPPVTPPVTYQRASLGLEIAFVPTFLWISDAFLLWRAWVVWTGHRWVLVVPGAVYIASIVTGIVWSVQGALSLYKLTQGDPNADVHLTDAVVDWIPALAFSCGMDGITTSLIAGRLGYYHYRQRRMVSNIPGNIYISTVTILIESAVLSTISKLLQLFVPGVKVYSFAVVPLCTIASSLILLRKALGADVGSVGYSLEGDSTSKFRPTHGRGFSDSTVVASFSGHKYSPSNASDTIPDRFESHLIEAVGGRAITIHVESEKVKSPASPPPPMSPVEEKSEAET